MGPYAGDFSLDQTVRLMFDTNDAAGGATGLDTAGTVSVYKDGSTTQSTAGVTVTNNFDGVTGIHLVEIDTSASTFYVVGADYHVVLAGGDIDGETINAVLGSFSIENRRTEVLTHCSVATDNTATSFTLGGTLSSTNDFYNGQLLVGTSGTNKGVVREITDYVGSTKVVTVAPGFPATPAADDRFQILGLG